MFMTIPTNGREHPPILITGLPNSVRDARLCNQLMAHGIDPVRELGVKPPPNEVRMDDFATGAIGFRALPGHLGCRLAHLNACSVLLSTQDHFAVILEDDALITDSFDIKAIVTIMGNLAGPAVLVLGRKKNIPLTKSIFGGNPQKDIVTPLIHGPAYSYAYAINREAATLVVQATKRFGPRGFSDWPPELAGVASFFALNTPMVDLDVDVPSTIYGDQIPIRVSALDRIAKLFRGLFISKTIPIRYIIFEVIVRNLHYILFRVARNLKLF
jgi:hypothetical protein